MNVGDRVRLRKPFQPTPGSLIYTDALIAGLIMDDLDPTTQPTVIEVILHLYSPSDGSIYTDEAGEPVIYSFYPQEIIVS